LALFSDRVRRARRALQRLAQLGLELARPLVQANLLLELEVTAGMLQRGLESGPDLHCGISGQHDTGGHRLELLSDVLQCASVALVVAVHFC
jgi:hypothetical protein